MFRHGGFILGWLIGVSVLLWLAGCPSEPVDQKCQRTSECKEGQKCLGGRCKQTCKSSLDCDADEVCDKAAGICEAKGSTDDGGGPEGGKPEVRIPENCGNGKLDPGEACDGKEIRSSQTCKALGFTGGGKVTCTVACQIDTSGCNSDPNCGNGKLDPGETCDGDDLRGQTCKGLGFQSGQLQCNGCQIDSSSCSNTPDTCGNDIREPHEPCEGTDLNGKTCQTQGFLSGELKCKDCQFDTSACAKAGTKKFGEKCRVSEECESLICTRLNATKDPFGYCGAKCSTIQKCPSDPPKATCEFRVGSQQVCGWRCTAGGTDCPAGLKCVAFQGGHFCGGSEDNTPPAKCGDDKAEGNEACDGTDLKNQTCVTKGFKSGALSCKDCKFDTTNCVNAGAKPKFGQRCEPATGCEAGLICLMVQGGGGQSFCTSECTAAPCPSNPPDSACLLQTPKGKFCGWLCAGGLKCPPALQCSDVSGTKICN